MAGIDRRTELFDEILAHDDRRQRGAQRLAIHPNAGEGVVAHALHIVAQRDGGRSDVEAHLEEFARALAPQARQAVPIGPLLDPLDAPHFDQLLRTQELEERIEHEVGESKILGDLRARRFARVVKRLHNELNEEIGIEPCLFERLRDRGGRYRGG